MNAGRTVHLHATALRAATLAVLLACVSLAQDASYLGFDRNDYPGDANLQLLRKTFSYAGYWLNIPPGTSSNTWVGHRAAIEAAGFGFLVLFNGRLYAELKASGNAQQLGQSDARAAAESARREGFPPGTVIFLDQEEGGLMLPQQKTYIYAWTDGITAAGFQAGIYCSGVLSKDLGKAVTAEDIRASSEGRHIAYWVINDTCPPSPGCSFPHHPPRPAESGVGFAEVWQFAQSPQRKGVAAHCTNYNRDRNCYPPGTGPTQGLHIDVNTATSPDPSHGRGR